MKNLIANTKSKVAKRIVKTVFRLLPLGLLAASCEKDPPVVNPVQHDTEYSFMRNDYSVLLDNTPIKASADSMQVKNVYLVPKGDWNRGNQHNMIHNRLVPAFQISPKVKGKGNFENLGVNAEDSLLLVSMGYTVNQK